VTRIAWPASRIRRRPFDRFFTATCDRHHIQRLPFQATMSGIETRGFLMDWAALLTKLADLEGSIGVENNTTLRIKILDAQDCILAMQKKMVDNLRRNSRRPAEDPFFPSRYAA
jgi:hypothetical protein